MTMIGIPLTDDRMAKLNVLAKQTGRSPDEFLQRRVDQLLDQPDEEFKKVAASVLEKYAELYRRLA